MKTRDVLFELIRYRVCGDQLNLKKENLTNESLSELFSLAKIHDITYIVASALIENKLIDKTNDKYKDFLSHQHLSVYRYENNDFVLGLLINLFEENGVDFIPMKGSIIKKMYPEPCMRTSCDIDLLIKEEDLERATKVLLEKGNAIKTTTHRYEHSFDLAANVHLELHFKLTDEGEGVQEVLDRIWEDAESKEGYNHFKLMSNETFYAYHFIHMANHFRNGGCGVRPFLDLLIMNRNMPYDGEKLNAMLEKCGLTAFANAAFKVSRVWFLGEESDQLTNNIESFILRSGIYGNIENRVAVSTEKKGRFKYILGRLFIPYSSLVNRYPSLKGRPYLTPFYCIRRWCRMLFVRRSKRAIAELKLSMNISPEVAEQARKLLEDLEI